MQKLNIAILSYRSAEFGGGQGVYVKDISKALKIAGHSVEVISGPPYPNLDPEIKLIKLPGLNLFETFSFKDRLKKFSRKKINLSMIIMNLFLFCLEAFLSQKHLVIGHISFYQKIIMTLL